MTQHAITTPFPCQTAYKPGDRSRSNCSKSKVTSSKNKENQQKFL